MGRPHGPWPIAQRRARQARMYLRFDGVPTSRAGGRTWGWLDPSGRSSRGSGKASGRMLGRANVAGFSERLPERKGTGRVVAILETEGCPWRLPTAIRSFVVLAPRLDELCVCVCHLACEARLGMLSSGWAVVAGPSCIQLGAKEFSMLLRLSSLLGLARRPPCNSRTTGLDRPWAACQDVRQARRLVRAARHRSTD